MQQIIIIAVFGYICGSIPFGKIAGNAKGLDIQKHGSGNIGFANAVRVLGWKLGIVVLVGDIIKGLLPTLLVLQNLGQPLAMVCGLAAVLGHVFPVWLGFKGGKAIATGLGVIAVLYPFGALVGVMTYLLVFGICRKSDISSLVAACSVAASSIFVSETAAYYFIGMAVFAFYTHRQNIKKYVQIYKEKTNGARA